VIVIYLLAAYLIGSIPSAVIICHLMRLPDPRQAGSNNPGTTNVLRIGSKLAAVLTLVCDAGKGAVPVLIAKVYSVDVTSMALIMLATFIGHLFPIYTRFIGGKGVATGLGLFLAFSWQLGIGLATIWLIATFLTRYSSAGAICAAIALPLLCGYYFAWPYFSMSLCISSLILLKHRGNMERLWHGTEPKI